MLFLSQERSPVRSSQTTFNAGLMHFEDKAYDEALPLFRESIDLYPTAKTLYFVGRTHGATGADAERERVYQETTARFPGSFFAEMASGWLLARKDKYAEALPHFRQALQLTPDDGGARYNVGVALIRTNDLQGAVGVLGERLDVGEMAARATRAACQGPRRARQLEAAADARKGRGSRRRRRGSREGRPGREPGLQADERRPLPRGEKGVPGRAHRRSSRLLGASRDGSRLLPTSGTTSSPPAF